ncbi:MAG TPA: ATP-binding cassette domain-containing protein [Solirubrobacteraceae bacterium]|nr:ATP-binding cassette domain-containing protein [Solirubrobacteraceae bacterium]
MDAAIHVEGVVKRFGQTRALDGLDLVAAEGRVLGLLGPNGAGKTTIVRVLATLLQPDEGRASVLGFDVVSQARAVRREIGLAGQFAAVDELLTGRENLRLFGGLFRMGGREARRRADELLERFDLLDAADRPAKTYSGGMRRRLDLASSLLTSPRMLFLDEPTTGLDPRSRNQIWAVVRELVEEGTTVLLTTQYLEEADHLAHRVAVIDQGRVIAEGTGDELKDQVGGAMVHVRLSDAGERDAAVVALGRLGCGGAQPGDVGSDLTVPAPHDGVGMVAEAAAALREAGVGVSDLGLRRPTLDDVFLELTGQKTDEPASPPEGEEESEAAAGAPA